MKASVKTAAYGLLKTLSKAEVEELIEVLSYHNIIVREDQRADALLNGTDGEKSAQARIIEGRTAGSTSIYMSGGQSVCPCCRR
jgi:hypothetical protein